MKYKVICFILSVLTLLFGALTYIFFRNETFLAKILYNVGFHFTTPMFEIENKFIKYYLPDWFWSFSFSNALYIIFNKPKEIYTPFFITSILGLLWEIIQKLNIVQGTGDFWDFIMYITAAFTAVLINILFRRICDE